MRSPFVYGKIAEGDCFLDREKETALLCDNFHNLTNTVLISPRRWGKSSLVRKACAEAESRYPDLRVCEVDLFNVRTEDEFYSKLASAVLIATSSKWDDLADTAKRFLSSFVPALSFGDVVNTFKVSFAVQPGRQSADEILDMPQRIAKEKNLTLVICVDEFQQIANFDDADFIQSKLRSYWQKHQNVAYCLYGSRRHMMTEIFTSPGKPFYKFGQNIFLDKVKATLWPDFIISRFADTGKRISVEQCETIVDLVDNNPYYVQQLSEMVWNNVKKTCNDNTVSEAFRSLVSMQAGLNLVLTQMLTITQQNLLHAVVDGNVRLTSQQVMDRYGLKNSLTVQRARKALTKLDIIDDFGGRVTFEDPVYAWWLKNVYFA